METKSNKTPATTTEPRKDDFIARLMACPPSAGTKKPTTWQQSYHKRFNAYGCM